MKVRSAIIFTIICFLNGCITTGETNSAVGTWSVMTASPQGDNMSTWIINDDLSGVLRTDQGLEIAMNNTSFGDGTLSFDVVFEIQGTEIRAKFVGTIADDEVTGEFQTDFGNVSAKGTRQ